MINSTAWEFPEACSSSAPSSPRKIGTFIPIASVIVRISSKLLCTESVLAKCSAVIPSTISFGLSNACAMAKGSSASHAASVSTITRIFFSSLTSNLNAFFIIFCFLRYFICPGALPYKAAFVPCVL